mmetsp:Transcript_95002/g.306740  ORF Transcript_95002/g.306740 Transcript_95002/m.306740 type:complete len:247 (+) Transcript_95002:121-861(+)
MQERGQSAWVFRLSGPWMSLATHSCKSSWLGSLISSLARLISRQRPSGSKRTMLTGASFSISASSASPLSCTGMPSKAMMHVLSSASASLSLRASTTAWGAPNTVLLGYTENRRKLKQRLAQTWPSANGPGAPGQAGSQRPSAGLPPPPASAKRQEASGAPEETVTSPVGYGTLPWSTWAQPSMEAHEQSGALKCVDSLQPTSNSSSSWPWCWGLWPPLSPRFGVLHSEVSWLLKGPCSAVARPSW